eukprot:TRINITY_DN55745_c0_g1_i1.p1 TRINITY_DN55745_c0_g1~~TRINITY_DN55745_c0_g1_i1.p1  ORF type:complete len:131 (+),score=32.73 TRINITY_DN55745_c0_g1_i1:90-482(+)
MATDISATYRNVAEEFLKFYYPNFGQKANRAALKALYRPHSLLTFEQKNLVGPDAIAEHLSSMTLPNVTINVNLFDAQPSAPDGIVLFVDGMYKEADDSERPMRFAHMFVLKMETPTSAYVHHEIFRLIM